VIRVARESDWPAIEAWRDEHFRAVAEKARWPRPVTGQRGLTSALWLVVERAGAPVAALSYTEQPHDRRRWVWDLYAAPGHAVAGLALGEFFERCADQDGYEIRAQTDPENEGFIKVLLGRGYECVAVELKRTAREAVEGMTG
jgi:hypothetical protein